MTDPLVVLCSRFALYPIHWRAFENLCSAYAAEGVVLSLGVPELPDVHRQLGWIDPGSEAWRPRLLTCPIGADPARWLRAQLRTIEPDAIWLQEEPVDRCVLSTLGQYYFRRSTRIAVAVCENIFPAGWPHDRLIRRALWHRVDVLLATASPSVAGIRRIGMPTSVRALTLVAGAEAPPADVTPATLSFEGPGPDFVVGFVGQLIARKGWRVLLDAVAQLPDRFGLVVAGDGPDREALLERASAVGLGDRISFLGLLPKHELWRAYAAMDCLVVPSLTTRTWKEQFGGVVADGLAAGIPVIGSTSGSIPEVIGDAGIVTREGDADALASALVRLAGEPELRRHLGQLGRERFGHEFAISAYAAKIATALELEPRQRLVNEKSPQP